MFGLFSKKKATLFSGTSGFASYFGISHGRSGGPATIDEALETSIVFAAAHEAHADCRSKLSAVRIAL
ncbi:hypothetical protein GCM10011345_08460 [Gemmobacter megaterium]|nr:hypothetical protein GCM10011345_08460 [Gemmobacter megaterium]